MIGMYSAAQNRERLDKIEDALQRGGLSADEREDLELVRDDLRNWLDTLVRIEGA
jgi:hypothetical protein